MMVKKKEKQINKYGYRLMPFGKHKGKILNDMIIQEASYCQWILNNFEESSWIWQFMNQHKETIKNNNHTYRKHYTNTYSGHADYDDDLADAYSFAMYDGGGFPFI